MKKTFTIFTFIFILFSLVIANAQWVLQSSGTEQTLRSVYFIDKHTGWTVGDNGTILNTINGGKKWKSLKHNSITANLNSVRFINEKTGWCVGDIGVILKTINKGKNWSYQYSGSSNALHSVYFINDKTGWCVGDNLVLKTTNSGTNWLIQTGFDTTKGYYSVNFINKNTGWICGSRGSALTAPIYKTTNSGINWIDKSVPGINSLRSIRFVNSLTGWVVGMTYTLKKTTDGGNSWFGLWDEKPSLKESDIKSPPATYTSVCFINQNTGWFSVEHSHGGRIEQTTDCGLTWFDVHFALDTSFYSVYFVNSVIGWAVGDFGAIYKSVNNSSMGPSAVGENNLLNNNYSLSQNYPNPFNPSTKIKFAIAANSVGQTFLSVYDILGNEVVTLVNEKLNAGTYEVEWNASQCPSGVYFYRLTTDSFTETKKMLLVK